MQSHRHYKKAGICFLLGLLGLILMPSIAASELSINRLEALLKTRGLIQLTSPIYTSETSIAIEYTLSYEPRILMDCNPIVVLFDRSGELSPIGITKWNKEEHSISFVNKGEGVIVSGFMKIAC